MAPSGWVLGTSLFLCVFLMKYFAFTFPYYYYHPHFTVKKTEAWKKLYKR